MRANNLHAHRIADGGRHDGIIAAIAIGPAAARESATKSAIARCAPSAARSPVRREIRLGVLRPDARGPLARAAGETPARTSSRNDERRGTYDHGPMRPPQAQPSCNGALGTGYHAPIPLGRRRSSGPTRRVDHHVSRRPSPSPTTVPSGRRRIARSSSDRRQSRLTFRAEADTTLSRQCIMTRTSARSHVAGSRGAGFGARLAVCPPGC
jgi:hypothetical protein